MRPPRKGWPGEYWLGGASPKSDYHKFPVWYYKEVHFSRVVSFTIHDAYEKVPPEVVRFGLCEHLLYVT